MDHSMLNKEILEMICLFSNNELNVVQIQGNNTSIKCVQLHEKCGTLLNEKAHYQTRIPHNILHVMCILRLMCVRVCSALHLRPTLCGPVDYSPQGSCDLGISRDAHFGGGRRWPCPSSGDLPNLGMEFV